MKDVTGKEKKGRRKPPAYEILAPAGSREALEAAVQNGADAIYLSGKDFGARKFAANFSREELLEAVDYCHERGVSVYVTVNTLLFNPEFEKLSTTLDYYYTIGVDAVIVQDMGVLNYIRTTYPDLDVHCSTQMSVQTVEDIRYLESLGVRRVVLGREMSLDDIRRAKAETSVELEVFIHGALCISLSGQCLLSSMIGGRSGNRGSCAQPCRQKYTLYNEEADKEVSSEFGDYLLSPKDLATAEKAAEVIEAGGFSLKIEGRMKKPEYVATVVRVYRQLIESFYTEGMSNKELDKALEDLSIFNRGFTKGHLFGETGENFMSMNSPGNQGIFIGKVIKQDLSREKITIALERDLSHNDEIQLQRREGTVGGRVERLEDRGKVVKHCAKGKTCEVNFKHRVKIGEPLYKTFDEALMKEARQTYHKELLEIPVKGEFTFKEGTPIRGRISDGKVNVVMETMEVPKPATGKSLTISGLAKQLSKLGGTPYKMDDIHIDLTGEIFVPAKEINELRRNLVQRLSEERVQRHRRDYSRLRPQKEGEDPKPLGSHEFTESTEYRSSSVLSRDSEQKKIAEEPSLQFTYSAENTAQLEKLIELGAKIIYYRDLQTLGDAFAMVNDSGLDLELIPEIYSAATGKTLLDYQKRLTEHQGETVLIQANGQIPGFSGKILIGDLSLNIVNDRSYQFYQSQGFRRLTLSPELQLQQIIEMNVDPGATEVFGYGHLPVMRLKHCPIAAVTGSGKDCGACEKNRYSLVDKMEEHYPLVRRNHCQIEVYHSKKHSLIEELETLGDAGVGYYRLNFLNESPAELEEAVLLHRKILKDGLTTKNRELLREFDRAGTTKGHLYRGVD